MGSSLRGEGPLPSWAGRCLGKLLARCLLSHRPWLLLALVTAARQDTRQSRRVILDMVQYTGQLCTGLCYLEPTSNCSLLSQNAMFLCNILRILCLSNLNNPSFYFCCHKYPAQYMQFNPLHNINIIFHSQQYISILTTILLYSVGSQQPSLN